MHGSSTGFPHALLKGVLALVFACAAAVDLGAADALLFRIFLKDGGALVSYGEFARISDRVVFSVPIGDGAEPRLHVITIPEAVVDWHQTDRYADAVRARRYAETRGEDDFALLVGQVTTALSDLAMTPDPARRLAMAQEARRNLAAWPAANHGFKAAEVAKLLVLFDDMITELRAAAGEKSFDIGLVAMTLPPPPMDLLPPPDALGAMELAYRAAMLSPEPSERFAMLQALAATLDQRARGEARTDMLRTQVDAALRVETRTARDYGRLVTRALSDAAERAARADLGGLQAIVARVLRADEALGRRRPGEIASLLAALDVHLDQARRLRLARDAWSRRVEAIKAYREAIMAPLERLRSFRKWLDRIRDFSGPDAAFLRPLADRARLAHLELGRVTPPVEAVAVHRTLAAALHMTRHAATLRRDAVSSSDSRIARDASAAAAGAIALGEQAAVELQRLISSQPTR